MQRWVESLVKAVGEVKTLVDTRTHAQVVEDVRSKARSWVVDSQLNVDSPCEVYAHDLERLQVEEGKLTGRRQLARWVELLLEWKGCAHVTIDDESNPFALVAYDRQRRTVQLLEVIPWLVSYPPEDPQRSSVGRWVHDELEWMLGLCRELSEHLDADNVEVWGVVCGGWGCSIDLYYLGTVADLAVRKWKPIDAGERYRMFDDGTWQCELQYGLSLLPNRK